MTTRRPVAAERRFLGLFAALGILAAGLMLALGVAPANAQKDGDCDESSANAESISDNEKDSKKSKKKQKQKKAAANDCEKEPPPPPQVSLANLRSPAPAATDVQLKEALNSVGFIDTWYSLTPSHPRLSLVEVSGTQADAARSLLLAEIDDLVTTHDAITRLLGVIDEAVARHTHLRGEIAAVEAELVELGDALDKTQAHLTGLRTELAQVVKGLQGAAVGMYVSEEQLSVSAIGDVGTYNTQQELDMRVDATIDELLGMKLSLEADIASAEARVARLEAEIDGREADRDALVAEAEGVAQTIDELTAEVAALTEHRITVENGLPQRIADTQTTRMLASAPVMGIPLVTLDSYVRAAEDVAAYYPSCAIRWELIAGIAKIESAHATHGGARVAADGDLRGRILGPLLDGSLEGTAVIKDSDGGRLDGNAQFDAAIGPFQFIPSTWSRHALDANNDGFANPHNVYDAALSAAGYLCASSNLGDDGAIARSVLSYNNSRKYLHDVTGAARNYIVSLALPESAFDPQTLEVTDGWAVGGGDAFEDIGQVGRAQSTGVSLELDLPATDGDDDS